MNHALIGALMIQLIFESLPVSSSGHVLLFTSRYPCPLYARWEGIFALPTIGVILFFFIRSWWPLTRLFVWRWYRFGQLQAVSRILIVRLAFYSLISVSVAVISYSLMKSTFHHERALPFLPYGFVITMGVLLSLRLIPFQKSYVSLTWYRALIIGCCQAIALVPGISRLATTYGACRWVGLSTRRSLEYSFLILMPLLCAAGIRDCVNFYRSGVDLFGPFEGGALVLGTLIEWFLLTCTYRMAERNRIWFFGFYMIIPVVLSLYVSKLS